jgi:hypothetical protein
MESVLALKPAVASLIATKVRVVVPLVKVNWAAKFAAKFVVVSLAPIPAASRVATVKPVVNPARAVVTRKRSLPVVALKSVMRS